MRKGPHQRMTLAGGGGGGDPIAAFNDGPFSADVGLVTVVLGATMLANDNTPNPTLIISIQNFVPNLGQGVLVGQDVQWTQDAVGLESFDYTIKDTVTMAESTATVTMSGVIAAGPPITNPTPPSSFTATEFHTLAVPKFGPGSITANDTFNNPVTVTVLNPQPVAGPQGDWVTIIDEITPGIFTRDLSMAPYNLFNQIEIECWGAQGGVGGILFGSGSPVPGTPEQVPGFGAHRLVTNLTIVPGTLFLSIAVAGVGQPGTPIEVPPGGVGNNIGTGGLAGLGFADNLSFGGRVENDSFGFPNGLPGSNNTLPGGRGYTGSNTRGACSGGGGQDAGLARDHGAGGGGGAGSAVTVGDATTLVAAGALNTLGPVLNAAGGGGGGAGIQANRRPGEDGGPPGPLRRPSTPTFASMGNAGQQTGASGIIGGVGGGGGGYRGGNGDGSQFAPLGGGKGGHGGESNDERYNRPAFGDGPPQPGGTRPNDGFRGTGSRLLSSWLTFSGSTTIEFASLKTGNGRVRIRGRVVEDQLGGTQFPINCFAVDAGPNVDVTPDVPFPGQGGPTPTVCSFFYFLTDTVTLQTSGVSEVEVDNIANVIIAVDEGGFLVSELVATNIPIATLLANDTFHDHPPTFTIVPGSEVDCTATIVGSNVVVTPISATISTTCSFQYEIDDPIMPIGFQLISRITPEVGLPKIVFEFRKAATATVSMVITSPTFIEIFDTGFNVPGTEQTFIIPPGVDNIEVECLGAPGGVSGGYGGMPQGLPGAPSIGASSCSGGRRRVSNISVTAGDVLSIATGTAGIRGTGVTFTNNPLGGAGGSGNTSSGPYNFPGGGNANGGSGGDGNVAGLAGGGGGGGGGTTVANSGGTIMCCAGGGGGGGGHSSSAGLSGAINCGQGSVNPTISGGEASSDGASGAGLETTNGPCGGGGGGFFGGEVTGGLAFCQNKGGFNGNQTGTVTADPFLGSTSPDGRVIIKGRLVP